MANPVPSLPALRVAALHAGYRDGKSVKPVLRGLDLEARPGRIYALLGPNGAGKTTLLRCLTGLLRPASGSIQLLDTEISRGFPPALRMRTGILLESPGVYARMTVLEYLEFFAGFFGMQNPAARIEVLAAAFELESLSARVGKLSQGNRRKVQLMRSLLHRPALILWDEPTEHLDPRAQRRALESLRNTVADGAAALVTSHRLEQMEEWADEYGFLLQGQVIYTLRREQLNSDADEAEIAGAGSVDVPALQALLVSRFGIACELSPSDPRAAGPWNLSLSGSEAAAALSEAVAFVVQGGGRILRAQPKRRTLEDIYRRTIEAAR